jgi:hypothetical protein
MKRVEEGTKAKKAKRASRASGASKSGAKAKKTANAGTKAKPGASEAEPIKVRKGEKVAVVWDRPAPAALGTDADDLDVLVAAILNAFVDRNEPFFESSRKAANVSSMGARSSD